MNAPPPPLFMFLEAEADRTDAPEPGAMPAAPLTTASAPTGPSVLTPVSASASPAAPVVVTPASQAPPAGATMPVNPHPVVGDSDDHPGDRVTSLVVGSPARAETRGVLALRHTDLPTGAPGANRADDEPAADDTAPALDAAPPAPRGADLIAEALPLAGDALERGLEEFVHQLEGVDVAGIVTEGPTPLVVATLSVAGAAAAAVVAHEVIRRRAARRSDGRLRIVDSMGRELALSFPELPRSWSERY